MNTLLEATFWIGVILVTPLIGYLSFKLSSKLTLTLLNRLFPKTYVELLFTEGSRKCRLLLDAKSDYTQTAHRRLKEHGFCEPTLELKRFHRNIPNPD